MRGTRTARHASADVISLASTRDCRQHLNQFAWRLGVPLIDAGVEAGVCSPESTCTWLGLCPAWNARGMTAIMRRLNRRIPASVQPQALRVPTRLRAWRVGGLASSNRVPETLEWSDWLCCDRRQVLVDAAFHNTTSPLSGAIRCCRFSSHAVWNIHRLNRSVKDLTLAPSLGTRDGGGGRNNSSPALRIEGKPFVKRLTCSGCGAGALAVAARNVPARSQTKCANAGDGMIATGFDVLERLNTSGVSRKRVAPHAWQALVFARAMCSALGSVRTNST